MSFQRYVLGFLAGLFLSGSTLALAQTLPPTASALVKWPYATANQDGFLVMRSMDGATPVQVGSMGKEVREFAEVVPVGILHCYTVIAFNAAGQAAPSTPPACAKKEVIPIPPALLPVSSVTVIFQ